jgi:hypothetical protein
LRDDEILDVFTSSCDENDGSQGHQVIDLSFQIGSHNWEMDFQKFYDDPIYDTSGGDSRDENANFFTIGKPKILEKGSDFFPLEQPCLINLCSENCKSNLQPYFPMNDSEIFQI